VYSYLKQIIIAEIFFSGCLHPYLDSTLSSSSVFGLASGSLRNQLMQHEDVPQF
jgi:hypothetical protein